MSAMDSSSPTAGGSSLGAGPFLPSGGLVSMALRSAGPSDGDMRCSHSPGRLRKDGGARGRREQPRAACPMPAPPGAPAFDCRVEQKAVLGLSGRVSSPPRPPAVRKGKHRAASNAKRKAKRGSGKAREREAGLGAVRDAEGLGCSLGGAQKPPDAF